MVPGEEIGDGCPSIKEGSLSHGAVGGMVPKQGDSHGRGIGVLSLEAKSGALRSY